MTRLHGPQMLPGGRAILLTRARSAQGWDQAEIVVHSLDTGKQQTVINGGTDARYLPTGHLVFARQGNLLAVPFDAATWSIRGGPVPVVEQVAQAENFSSGAAQYAFSSDGTLAYVPAPGGGQQLRTLVWADRQGREEPIGAAARAYVYARLSPDGTRVALDVQDDNRDIWVWDLRRQTLTRLTTDPALDRMPVWTRDGRRIIFGSDREGSNSLFWQSADGSVSAERLLTQSPEGGLFPFSVSPDGSRLLLRDTLPATGTDIFSLSLDGSRRLEPLVQTPFIDSTAEISPDGRWLAYQSDSSGRMEIYVRPFPDVSAGQSTVSTAGGVEPLWRPDGHELFYRAPDGSIWGVPVQRGSTWAAGVPGKLVDGRPYYSGNLVTPNTLRSYDVSADGQRFLMIKNAETGPSASAARIIVVQNWFEELKRRVPVK